MANKKISEMTYKTLALDDQIPTVNSSSPGENFYALGADVPVLLGNSQWNSSTVYPVGHIVSYNSATTKGLFMVRTTTLAGYAPEGVGYDYFNVLGLGWVENTFNANSADYFLDIAGKRTGVITWTEAASIGDTVLIVLTGDFTYASHKNLIVTNNSAPTTGETFTIEYYNSQINIYITLVSAYATNGLKLRFELHG